MNSLNEISSPASTKSLQRMMDCVLDENESVVNLQELNDSTSEAISFTTERSVPEKLLFPRSVKGTKNPPRKKQRNPGMWKKNILKRARDQGKEYVNLKGKSFPARKPKLSTCGIDCNYNCRFFTDEIRKNIHTEFWLLSDAEKKIFYSKFVECKPIARKRTKSEESRREKSFKYYFETNGRKIQICKSLFLSTLDISQQRIYYFFKKNFDKTTGTPNLKKKRLNKYRKTSEEILDTIRKHIESFPVIDPHYVRADSQKQYLEADLSLAKMYSLYKEIHANALKMHMYRKIFNTEYNLAFYKPKKDQCDNCSKFKNIKKPTEEEIIEYEKHKEFNDKAKIRRQEDRNIKSPEVAVVSYDLQSVFTLPRANISNFYYKSKFSMYNLTGLCHLNKITYCSLWYESQSGRSGNDIASALVKILKAIIADNPQITKIILWSDACIPQNKNKITSLAILKFLEEYPQVKVIEQKFSSGHSRIQELDAVHSVIDRHLKNISYYSPLSLFRQLKSMKYENVHLKLMQLQKDDFFNFSKATAALLFIPYSKVKEIIYNDLTKLKYREDYGEQAEVKETFLFKMNFLRTKGRNIINEMFLPKVTNTIATISVNKEKKKDIESMMPWMPIEDVEFYNALFKTC